MKLVEQRQLSFKEGKSDKVYQVDLCKVGPDAFVVNFRYGRRGSNLREGTKTESPVPERKARAIYERLVASKTTKGYSDEGQVEQTMAEPRPVATPSSTTLTSKISPTARALLADLAKGERSERPLARIIWRVGELALHEAEPYLLELLALPKTAKEHLRVYSIVWALGRCGGAAAIAPLQALLGNSALRSETRVLIAEALRGLGDDALRNTLALDQLSKMSGALREAVEGEHSQRVQEILLASMERNDDAFATYLVAAYCYASAKVNAGLHEVLRRVPLQRGMFKAVRAIFKLAEFRRDARIFGLLAHRFETTRPNPSGWYDKDEVFKIATRRYLRRRVARALKRLGEAGSADFVPMAVGTLLPFTDGDAKAVRRSTYSSYQEESGSWAPSTVCWDVWAGYWALNTLLYSNSERYAPDDNGNAWRCAPGYLPIVAGAGGGQEAGATETSSQVGSTVARSEAHVHTREEAFPALWDARPEALLHLVDESQCLPVHQMVVKVLRANPSFCASLDIDALTLFLKAAYQETVQLGFELIKSRPMSGPLVWLLTACALPEGRAHAHKWLRNYVPAPFDDAALWASLVLSPHADNREFVRSGQALYLSSDAMAQKVIAKVVAELKGSVDEEEHYAEAGQILLATFARQAKSLGEEVLRDLLSHDLLCVQQVGADLLVENDRLAREVPEDILIALIDSEHASIRIIGTRLLDKKMDLELVKFPELFIHLALHELADLREGCRPTIERLAKSYPEFGRHMAEALSAALSRALPKGAPADAVLLLRGALQPYLPTADKDQTLRLLKAKSPHARELGSLYLKQIRPEELTLFDIVVLANHEMLSIRQAAWALCEASVDRFRLTMPAIARLLDAKWQDTREFGLRFVQEKFGPDDLGPAVLIAICDSVRPDVQRYGQDLIAKNFRERDGQEYLAKLSEHPSTKLQLFVTNYLERYAVDDVTKLEALVPYFLSVLSGVSRGGVAKRRVLRFLSAEGLKSQAAAVVVAQIMTRQSVTIAIENKASIIESMVALQDRYPGIELPIALLKTEARHAV